MSPLHLIIFAFFFQLTGLFVSPFLLCSILLVDFNQLKLFLIVSLTIESRGNESASKLDGRLSFQEISQTLVSEDKHFFVFSLESQTSQKLLNSSEIHNLVLDCVISRFNTSILLLEGVANNAKQLFFLLCGEFAENVQAFRQRLRVILLDHLVQNRIDAILIGRHRDQKYNQ